MQSREFPKLRECPFCGGEATVKQGNIYMDKIVLVTCSKCHVRTDFVFIDHPKLDCKTGGLDESTRYTERQAVEKAMNIWNRRATDER